ncbi:MAG: hypothetical protein AB7O26_09085, partial [Planctomycetaceae bacterium]
MSEIAVGASGSCDSVCEQQTCCDDSSILESDCGICCGPTLTGDWCGVRSSMQESGVTFAGRSTHFGFAVDGGVNSPFVPPVFGQGDSSAYTGRGEYDFLFN